MSLLPYLFDDSRFSVHPRYTGAGRNWLVDDDFWRPVVGVPAPLYDYQNYLRNLQAALQTDTGVTYDKDRFQASIDVQHFKPDEISVKVNENTVGIEGKHEEKHDEHGQIYRHFVRKYKLPADCDKNKVESRLSSDGVLTICAPRLGQKEQAIPITRTGEPAKIQQKSEKN
ncbi:unnamed protein product [Callosobruchus maculatus]|uniref:SHSP domain-containing protein n=1 Tax=Callosobruchus maculatus TaxID=64391 RepID=A0A653DG38_CALMS|nr:unnamed protein product [Callosobruchus maculatus]